MTDQCFIPEDRIFVIESLSSEARKQLGIQTCGPFKQFVSKNGSIPESLTYEEKLYERNRKMS